MILSSNVSHGVKLYCTSGIQKALCLRRFLQNLEVIPHATVLSIAHCDSMKVLAYMTEYKEKSKRIQFRITMFEIELQSSRSS